MLIKYDIKPKNEYEFKAFLILLSQGVEWLHFTDKAVGNISVLPWNMDKILDIYIKLTGNKYDQDWPLCALIILHDKKSYMLMCDDRDAAYFKGLHYIKLGLGYIKPRWKKFLIDVCVAAAIFLTALTGKSLYLHVTYVHNIA